MYSKLHLHFVQALKKSALARRQVLPWGCKELPAPPKPPAMDQPAKVMQVSQDQPAWVCMQYILLSRGC